MTGACLACGILSPLEAQLATPTFTNVTVHDPSVVRLDGTYYVFGSHLASARTDDLLHWTQISTDPVAGNPLVPNPAGEFEEALAWVGSNSGYWAPDVIRLPDGRFYFYYCIGRLDQPRAALGLAVADAITGPYRHVAVILRSGPGGQPIEAGPFYDATIHPNTIDPAVFFDATGKFWMVYGSYSGGIFILAMDATTGLPLPGQGYGKKLIGGNHARIEGAYVLYSPESEYYYLFVSFGGLGASDGYNIRLGRSRNPDGPYVDAAGTDLATVAGAPGTLFDDASIAPHGVKLMGSYQFLRVPGEPGTASRGYRSPGHNSALYDAATGKYFLVFHTRFVGTGELHEVRVHQMYLNEDGWLVVAPHRYAQETASAVDATRVPGSYKLINHGKAISGAVNTSVTAMLQADRTISGAAAGTWELTGDRAATFNVDGVVYRGVFAPQWDDDSQVWVQGFSALSSDGVALWGSRVAEVVPDVAPEIVRQPEHRAATVAARVTVSAGVTGMPPPAFQWRKNGAAVAGATGSSHTIASATVGDAGLYAVAVTGSTAVESEPAIVGLLTADKVLGAGSEVGPDIRHQNGNRYDQVLLEGVAATITADPGEITRISFCDVTNDIVQVEFSGAGALTVSLDAATGPAAPENYHQPTVAYMKGNARIVIVGADETTNVSVFSVGRATAFDPTGAYNYLLPIGEGNEPARNGSPLFDGHGATDYDGWASIASIAISSSNGRFGGIRTGNTSFLGTAGIAGIYAPGVSCDGPVVVGNITAADAAVPMLVLGGAADVRVAGGDLAQPNGRPVRVSGFAQLRMTAGSSSHGAWAPARAVAGRLEEDGVDVTDRVVVGP